MTILSNECEIIHTLKTDNKGGENVRPLPQNNYAENYDSVNSASTKPSSLPPFEAPLS